MKRTLMSLLTVCAAAALLGLLGGGTLAALSDTETSAGNSFTAGTLLLKVNGESVPGLLLPVGPVTPGGGSSGTIQLTNDGTIDGVVEIKILGVDDAEGDNPSTETGSLAEPGELSQLLQVSMTYDGTPLASGAVLSSLSGASYPSLALGAHQTRNLDVSWSLPASDALGATTLLSDTMGDTAGLTVQFTLSQH